MDLLFSTKFIILYIFLGSMLYVHFRGQVRFKFLRQLFDHSTFIAPINSIMYLFSAVPNKPFLEVSRVPELQLLRKNWKVIREEAQKLVEQGHIKASENFDDAGFNSFFKTGWKRFYLKWYQDFLPSAQSLCPKTVELLKSTPSVNAAMFALLSKKGKLVTHRDPYAGSLRYHLGLMTPNSEKCRIIVDGIPYAWKDGEDVLFDETYIHTAENDTEQDRIILFCDVERPLNNSVAVKFNQLVKRFLMAEAASPNSASDKVGFINRLFKYLYKVRQLFKRLKKWNKKVYYGVKYSFFFGLFYLMFLS